MSNACCFSYFIVFSILYLSFIYSYEMGFRADNERIFGILKIIFVLWCQRVELTENESH